MQKLLDICADVGMPMAPNKFVTPCKIIEFLGLFLDSILMGIRIPQDKVTEFIQMLQTALKAYKAMVKYLQSLTGKLNFVCKAILQCHTFLHHLYDASTGLKLHYHIYITGKVCNNFLMWKYFLSNFNSLMPIISNDMRRY